MPACTQLLAARRLFSVLVYADRDPMFENACMCQLVHTCIRTDRGGQECRTNHMHLHMCIVRMCVHACMHVYIDTDQILSYLQIMHAADHKHVHAFTDRHTRWQGSCAMCSMTSTHDRMHAAVAEGAVGVIIKAMLMHQEVPAIQVLAACPSSFT